MAHPLDVKTTTNEIFTYAQSCELAHMVYVRFGKDLPSAASAWRRMLQNNASDASYMQLVSAHLTKLGEKGDEITFNIWHDGDPSVGIPGEQARVTMFCADDNDREWVRASLRDFYTNLWDHKGVHVMTDAELTSKEGE